MIVLAIGPRPTGFYWTPLALGLVYLAGALSGGPHGKLLGDGGVLIGWGAAVVVVRQLNPNSTPPGSTCSGRGSARRPGCCWPAGASPRIRWA